MLHELRARTHQSASWLAIVLGIVGCGPPRDRPNHEIDAAPTGDAPPNQPDAPPNQPDAAIDAPVDATITNPDAPVVACQASTWKMLPAGAGLGEVYDIWASASNNVVAVTGGVKQF